MPSIEKVVPCAPESTRKAPPSWRDRFLISRMPKERGSATMSGLSPGPRSNTVRRQVFSGPFFRETWTSTRPSAERPYLTAFVTSSLMIMAVGTLSSTVTCIGSMSTVMVAPNCSARSRQMPARNEAVSVCTGAASLA